jgi:hypothetical protein
MKPIAEADKFDIAKYLRCIRDHHTQPRVYTPDSAAMDKFSECKAKLQSIVEESNRGYVQLSCAFS